MKALTLLITLRDDYIHGELNYDINEAIKELEAYITKEKMNKEIIGLKQNKEYELDFLETLSDLKTYAIANDKLELLKDIIIEQFKRIKMKALELLRQNRDYYLLIAINNSVIEKYDEAIKELEDLKNRSCENCKHNKKAKKINEELKDEI